MLVFSEKIIEVIFRETFRELMGNNWNLDLIWDEQLHRKYELIFIKYIKDAYLFMQKNNICFDLKTNVVA